MGLGHSPRIVTDGMVLYLDAANPKNYNLTEVEVLVVAGGGSGGYGESNVNGGGGGGGGAGGLIYNQNFSVIPGTALTVTIGNGGASPGSSTSAGNNGGNSVFGSLTAIGGGAGGGGDFEGTNAGATGGSGGGAGGDGTYGPTIFSAGTAGQGFAGGARNGTTNRAAAGGGGAGGVGSSGTPGANSTGTGGAGGPGLGFNISGTLQYYGGGGGGGASNNFSSGVVNSSGGIGGGAAGGGATGPSNGTANTGGGGGGGYGSNAGAGGSGIVIVRYQGPQKAIGGTITSNNGYTIHTFTTVGSTTFTPLVATNNSAILGLSDFSGNNNFGTAVNGPTFNSGNGGSLIFDGVDDYALTSGIVLPTANSSPLTLEAVAMTTSESGWQTVLGTHSSFTQIGFNGTTFYFGRNGGAGNLLVSSGVSVSTNTWCHMTMTYDGSLGYSYLNGIFRTSGSIGSNGATNGVSLLSTYTSSSPQERLTGRIAVARIYNRALTAAEVQQNFNALRGRFGI